MKARKVRLEDGSLVRVQSVRAPRCSKLAYPSKKVALAKAAEQRRNTGEMIRAYHCDRCHCFHMGHPWGQRGKVAEAFADGYAEGARMVSDFDARAG